MFTVFFRFFFGFEKLKRERWNLVSQVCGNKVRESAKKIGACANMLESKLQRSASVGNRPTALSIPLGVFCF